MLKQRWRILRAPIKGQLENIELTIIACCCLHNYVKNEGVLDNDLAEDVQSNEMEDAYDEEFHCSVLPDAVAAREALKNYMAC